MQETPVEETSIGQRLRRLWCKQLNREICPSNEDFFSLGGTTLKAIRLFGHISDEFGRLLPASTILEAPTIEKLEKFLQRPELDEGKAIFCPMAGQEGGRRLYFLHSMNGDAIDLRFVIKEFPQDIYAKGVRARRVGNEYYLFENFLEMGKYYAAKIAEDCKGEEVILAGHSLGSSLSFVVGAELQSMGVQVNRVFFIDGYPPDLDSKLPLVSWSNFLRAYLSELPTWLYHFVSQEKSWLRETWLHFSRQWAGIHWVDLYPPKQRVLAYHLEELYYSATLPIAKVSATLFKANIMRLNALHGPDDFDWPEYVKGDFSVLNIDGDHMTVIKPPSARLVAQHIAGDR